MRTQRFVHFSDGRQWNCQLQEEIEASCSKVQYKEKGGFLHLIMHKKIPFHIWPSLKVSLFSLFVRMHLCSDYPRIIDWIIAKDFGRYAVMSQTVRPRKSRHVRKSSKTTWLNGFFFLNSASVKQEGEGGSTQRDQIWHESCYLGVVRETQTVNTAATMSSQASLFSDTQRVETQQW